MPYCWTQLLFNHNYTQSTIFMTGFCISVFSECVQRAIISGGAVARLQYLASVCCHHSLPAQLCWGQGIVLIHTFGTTVLGFWIFYLYLFCNCNSARNNHIFIIGKKYFLCCQLSQDLAVSYLGIKIIALQIRIYSLLFKSGFV